MRHMLRKHIVHNARADRFAVMKREAVSKLHGADNVKKLFNQEVTNRLEPHMMPAG